MRFPEALPPLGVPIKTMAIMAIITTKVTGETSTGTTTTMTIAVGTVLATTTATKFAVGMPRITATFRPGLPRKIGCLRAWYNFLR